MASTKIRGITIELGADTSGLSKALSGANKEIKSTEKSLKDVERLLKLDPTNTELLEQKQRLLGDRVEQTKDKLNALKEAQKQVGDELAKTGEGQAQYDALSREIAQTELELKDAERAASSFNARTAKISATAGKISDKFGTLAQKTRALSTAAAGALVGLGGLAVKAGQSADELTTLSKQTGIATDDLQKMQYASDLIDVDVSTITGSLKKLKKGLDSNADAFENLGVATKKNGQFRDITDIFYDTVDALSKIPNETERDIAAMDIFGKSADELAGIIDDGGASLKALGEEAENLGVIIPEEDLEAANQFNDALDKLKAEGMGTLMQVGAQIAEMILPYLPQIQQAIERVMTTLRDMDPEVLKIVAGALALTAALSPMFSIVSKISGVISTLTSSTGALGAAFGGMSAPLIGIIALLGTLAAAFVYLWQTDEDFKNNVTGMWSDLVGTFQSAGASITQALNDMGGSFNDFSEVAKAAWEGLCKFLKPFMENSLNMVKNVIQNVLKAITGIFEIFAGLFTGDWSRLWNGIKQTFSGVWSAILSILKGTINSMINVINGLIGGINLISVNGHSPNIPKIPLLAEGGILTSGSAIVGERGAELLTVSNGAAMVEPLGGQTSELTQLLETYLPYLAAGTSLVMDSGALVGSIAPDMNAALGTIAIRGGRR